MQLLQLYQPFMGAVLLISEGARPEKPQESCQRLKQLWEQTEELIAKQGWSKALTSEAAFAVCVWADERLLLSPQASTLAWEPLQSQRYQTHCGGEEFFSRLETLFSRYDLIEQGHPSRVLLNEVVAVFGACLAAHFKGRYYHAGEEPLQRLRQRISQQLLLPAAPVPFDILPQHEVLRPFINHWRRFDPLTVLLIAAALISTLLVLLMYQDLLATDRLL